LTDNTVGDEYLLNSFSDQSKLLEIFVGVECRFFEWSTVFKVDERQFDFEFDFFQFSERRNRASTNIRFAEELFEKNCSKSDFFGNKNDHYLKLLKHV
jgi:hypothetical protein